jgi:UDP-N-acetylmuramoyl-L-alanyl-D-glutamate--2,6-diaminopimelate ligase
MMGAVAEQGADVVVLTSDNPRREKPEAIVSQILLGCSAPGAVQVQVDRALAIAQTLAQAGPDDVVLVAGKGHETHQEIAGEHLVFSDAEHAARALATRSIS